MGLFTRLGNNIKSEGILFTFVKLYIMLVDVIYDGIHGIETSKESFLENLLIKSENKSRGNNYVPARVVALRKLFNILNHWFPENSVFVDIGSGKGRVLFIASEFGFREARGIEFAPELVKSARQNSTIYKARTHTKTEFSTIEADIVTYEIKPDEVVFFMNNPFDRVILGKVLDNMTKSVEQNHRKIFIIYFCPTKSDLLDSHPAFKRLQTGKVYRYDFILYTNVIE